MKKNNLLTVIAIGLIAGIFLFFLFFSFKKGSNTIDEKVDLLIVEMVSDYVETNIYSLSSQEAVLGGSFYVESTRVLNGSSGVVDFEDGHLSYRAKFNFIIDKGEVFVNNFNILSDNKEKVNFSKTGNLIFKNHNWSLVYEDAAGAVDSVFLKFNDVSKCISNKEIINCSEDILKNGDKVSLSGFRESDNLLIYTLEFLFDKKIINRVSGSGSI
jgi:hypothetical protein